MWQGDHCNCYWSSQTAGKWQGLEKESVASSQLEIQFWRTEQQFGDKYAGYLKESAMAYIKAPMIMGLTRSFYLNINPSIRSVL